MYACLKASILSDIIIYVWLIFAINYVNNASVYTKKKILDGCTEHYHNSRPKQLCNKPSLEAEDTILVIINNSKIIISIKPYLVTSNRERLIV